MRALGPGIVAIWLGLTAAGCGFDTSGVTVTPITDGRVAAADGGPVDGPVPDASPPDAMPDAMPDAEPCGSEGLVCCMTGDACDATSECGDADVCTACGDIFQSCCDHGDACRGLTFCSFGTCLGL
jgi:hypothetical protein